MDQNETSTELTTELETEGFGKELGKLFVRTTVSATAGWTGLFIALAGVGTLSNWLRNRKSTPDQTVPSETV